MWNTGADWHVGGLFRSRIIVYCDVTGLCTDEQILAFVDFCPAGDIHTITDVNLLYIGNIL